MIQSSWVWKYMYPENEQETLLEQDRLHQPTWDREVSALKIGASPRTNKRLHYKKSNCSKVTTMNT